MKNLTVVFDLDGTLVDTAPDLIKATNHVLELVEAPPVDSDVLLPMISFGARAMIEQGLKLAGREIDEETKLDRLFDEFITYYSANIAVESRPFPGVEGVLRVMHESGARLAVCTNKQESLSRKLLKELGLHPLFHAVVGRDTLPVHKPDPGHLIGTVILADGNPGRAIMVGDSDTDIQTAKRAGIPVVGCTFGYSEKPIAEFDPDTTIDGYDELPRALTSAQKAFA